MKTFISFFLSIFLLVSCGSSTDKSESKAKDSIKFSTENALGVKHDNPTVEMLNTSIDELNEENDFLILNGKDGFIQAAVSDDLFIIQYKENDKMFESQTLFNIDELKSIFAAYLTGNEWKDMAQWAEM